MSKRRVRVNLKSQCVPYLDLDPSPSKRRNFRTRTLPLTRVVDISGAEVHSKEDIESDNKGVTFFSFDGDNEQEDLPHPDTNEPSGYEKRQQKLVEYWAEVRGQLLRASVETSIPLPSSLCVECEQVTVALCRDCGPQAYYCANHVEIMHSTRNIFHRPHLWKVSFPVTFFYC